MDQGKGGESMKWHLSVKCAARILAIILCGCGEASAADVIFNSPVSGVQEKFVDRGDGSYARAVAALGVPLATSPATVANGASLSGAIDLGTARLFAIQMPAAWTAASVTFQASSDCSTYANLFNDAGTEVAATVAASQYIVMASPAAWLGIRCLKVRSGTSGTPVNQGADRVLTIVAVP